MKVILIILLLGSYDGGPRAEQVEFSSMDQCQKAASVIRDGVRSAAGYRVSIRVVLSCVYK